MVDNESTWDLSLQFKTCGRDESGADQYHHPYEPTVSYFKAFRIPFPQLLYVFLEISSKEISRAVTASARYHAISPISFARCSLSTPSLASPKTAIKKRR